MNIKQFLDERQIDYEVLPHPASYQASELAHTLHVHGRLVAKSVLIHANHGYHDVVAVLPATLHVDLAKLSSVLGGAEVHLGTEQEIRVHCPDCDAGVLPPFGSHYGIETVVDSELAQDDQIIIEGNTHEEAIRLRFADFQRLEHPLIADIATRP